MESGPHRVRVRSVGGKVRKRVSRSGRRRQGRRRQEGSNRREEEEGGKKRREAVQGADARAAGGNEQRRTADVTGPDPKGFNPVLVDWIQKPIQIRFCGGPE